MIEYTQSTSAQVYSSVFPACQLTHELQDGSLIKAQVPSDGSQAVEGKIILSRYLSATLDYHVRHFPVKEYKRKAALMFAAHSVKTASRCADRDSCTLSFHADPKEATPSLLLDRPCTVYLISSNQYNIVIGSYRIVSSKMGMSSAL